MIKDNLLLLSNFIVSESEQYNFYKQYSLIWPLTPFDHGKIVLMKK